MIASIVCGLAAGVCLGWLLGGRRRMKQDARGFWVWHAREPRGDEGGERK